MKIQLIIWLLYTSFFNSHTQIKINTKGEELKMHLLSMDVEHLWLAKSHVNWETGVPDMPGALHGDKTHCSAFVAAACKRLGIYILRPPGHSQILLANAQAEWLNSETAKNEGWKKIPDDNETYNKAQELANEGKLVVAICKNDDISEPGHDALVMPDNRAKELIANEGPEIIMAGTHNYNYISLRNGFRTHIQAWPAPNIRFYFHDVVKL